MKKYNIIVFLFIICLVNIFLACDNDTANNCSICDNGSMDNNCPTCDNNSNGNNDQIKISTLRVVNNFETIIISVSLVGYEFNSLNITHGNSQTFALAGGMPGGYNNINVIVRYRNSAGSAVRSINKNYNFINGGTTTVTLSGFLIANLE